jgi:hypothetical protein
MWRDHHRAFGLRELDRARTCFFCRGGRCRKELDRDERGNA